MKFLAYCTVLSGLSIRLLGVALAADHNTANSGFNLTSTANDDGWPPFYSTSQPQNLCGDTVGHNKTSNKPPKASDCAALRDQLDATPGFWNITADPGRSSPYILIAGYYSCAFVIAPLDCTKDCLVGTEDARDLLSDLVNSYSGYSISSTMECTVDAEAAWAIVYSKS